MDQSFHTYTLTGIKSTIFLNNHQNPEEEKKTLEINGGQKHSIKMVGDTTVNMIGIKHENYKKKI